MNVMRLFVLAALALAVWPPAASADSVVAPAPGAVNLASGGGWLAWAEPGGEPGWRLVLRAPDGTVSRPDVPGFARAPRASIGSRALGAERRLVAVYARDDGDVHELDLATGNEQRFRRASTRAYRESAPSIELGTLVFVRRGGRRNGTFQLTRRNRLRRIARATPPITVTNGSRFAYVTGRTVVLRRLSLRGPTVFFRNPSRPLGLTLTRYRMGWLLSGGRVFQTLPFGGSGRRRTERRAEESARRLPATTRSIALQGSTIALFLDAEAVKLAAPPLFP